jgi:hypothetical protein
VHGIPLQNPGNPDKPYSLSGLILCPYSLPSLTSRIQLTPGTAGLGLFSGFQEYSGFSGIFSRIQQSTGPTGLG